MQHELFASPDQCMNNSSRTQLSEGGSEITQAAHVALSSSGHACGDVEVQAFTLCALPHIRHTLHAHSRLAQRGIACCAFCSGHGSSVSRGVVFCQGILMRIASKVTGVVFFRGVPVRIASTVAHPQIGIPYQRVPTRSCRVHRTIRVFVIALGLCLSFSLSFSLSLSLSLSLSHPLSLSLSLSSSMYI